MHIIYIILIVLIATIAVVLIAALFIPKTYTVSVSTVIEKPISEVFSYIKIIRNQEHYSVWVMQDPNIVLNYTGTDGTVGFKAAWVSQIKNVGEGEQEIMNIVENKQVDMQLRFKKPVPGEQKASTFTEALTDAETRITAEFYGNAPYPINLMSAIGKSIITKAQTQNLANLKKVLEN